VSPEDYEELELKVKDREKKLSKKKNIMRVNSRGLKTLIQPLLGNERKPKKKSDFSRVRVTTRFIKSYTFEN